MTIEADIDRMTPEEARAKLQGNYKTGERLAIYAFAAMGAVAFTMPFFNLLCFVAAVVFCAVWLMGAYRKGRLFSRLLIAGVASAAMIAWTECINLDAFYVEQSTKDAAPLIAFAWHFMVVKFAIYSFVEDARYRQALEAKAQELAA